MQRTLFILILALCRPAFGDSTNGGAAKRAMLFRDPSQPIEQRVQDLVGRLTLDEKVSLVRTNSPPIPRLGIAGFNWWSEALHGAAKPYSKAPATCFPQALGMAASWDPALMWQVGDAISDELRARYNHHFENGLSVFDPNINILRDPRWGRAPEAAGKLIVPDLTKSNKIPPADGNEVDRLYRDPTRWMLGGLQDHLNGISLAKYPVNPAVLDMARKASLVSK